MNSMVDATIYKTFKQGSKTFFTTSLFFPRAVREDVFVFYAFVRVADDLVDSIPAQTEKFFIFKQKYAAALAGTPANDVVIDSFVELVHRRQIPLEWIQAFLRAMTMDTEKKTYATLEELSEYMYGSAEVIGLVMAKLMNLQPEAYTTAQLLGRGFQYVNFIRDIAEDITLGRQYLPHEVLHPFGFSVLSRAIAHSRPAEFVALIKCELDRYRQWQQEGEVGFRYIPKRFLGPIKTAADMYRYTAKIIERDPFIIFNKKVKPNKYIILTRLLLNFL